MSGKWTLSAEAFEFLKKSSHELSTAGQAGNTAAHGTGHSSIGINGSTGGFVLCSVIILVLITIFLSWKVYKDKKFFSKDWEKQYGPSKLDPNYKKKLREA